jgi:hypothetical protein
VLHGRKYKGCETCLTLTLTLLQQWASLSSAPQQRRAAGEQLLQGATALVRMPLSQKARGNNNDHYSKP